MPIIAIGGDTLHYTDNGSGIPVIFVHGSCGGARQWSGMARELQTTHRTLCLDMIGAGESSPWPEGRTEDPSVDARCFDALLKEVSGPVHFVIHSCGGFYSFPTLQKYRTRILSVSFFEPVFFHLLRQANNPHFAEARDMSESYLSHVERGDVEGGLALFVDHWAATKGTWAALPEQVRAKMRTWSARLCFDWKIVDSINPTREEIAALGIPMLLVNGTRTIAAMQALCELLGELLPTLTRATIKGAGHMSPFTHVSEATSLVRQHIEAADQLRQ